SCPEGHYDPVSPSMMATKYSSSEYSSCPEGHYDSFGTLGPLLSPLDRNTPPARKGITTLRQRRERHLCHSSEYSSCPEGHYDTITGVDTYSAGWIGILLLPGRALRHNGNYGY